MIKLVSLLALLSAISVSAEVRQPAAAGRFYPEDPELLRSDVQAMLAGASTDDNEAPARALIVPHAGFDFSGPTAAQAFARLAGSDVHRVILLGPSHHYSFGGGALPGSGTTAFATPLGPVPLDLEALSKLRGDALFDGPSRAHVPEHALEVELPFLQVAVPSASLVPIIVGSATDYASCVAMARSLAALVDDHTVVIASSDFTHHGDRYGWRPFTGPNVPERLLRIGRETAGRAVAKDARGFVRQVEVSGDTVCGVRPVTVLAALVDRAFTGTGELLDVTTSGHLTKRFDLSVTYVSAVFRGAWTEWQSPAEPPAVKLGPADGEALTSLARAVLESTLNHDTEVARWFASHPDRSRWEQAAGAFVTLNNRGKKARTEGRLRACMGVVQASGPLIDAVIQAARWTTEDPRFPPLQLDELDEIEIEVSVLSPMKPVRSHRFIKVGTHGVLLSKNGRRALYLPQVAVEQGWNLETMLDHLSLKAGLPRKAWQDGATFEIFTAQVFDEER